MSKKTSELDELYPEYDLAKPLKGGMRGKYTGRLELDTILSELRHALGELYGSRLIELILFGSQARGDAVPGSDIDIMVVLKGPVDPFTEIERAGDITANISLKYNVVISNVFMSEERFKKDNASLLVNVRHEGVSL